MNLYGGKVSAAARPQGYALGQNYPNPFNPVTTIRYQLPEASHVTLVVYNVRGQEVARLVDGYQTAGFYSAQWNASNVSSGIYLYRIEAGAFTAMKRMVVIKKGTNSLAGYEVLKPQRCTPPNPVWGCHESDIKRMVVIK